jgi:hypothetical protein
VRVLILFSALALAACQSAPRAIAPDTARAACVGQEYLRTNGFLSAAPKGRVVLLDTDLRYEVDGVLRYEQLVKERRGRFSRKLQGVWSQEDSTKYVLVYGPIDRSRYCLGIKHDFSFAYFRKSCDDAGAFTKLRERDLTCDAKN